MKKQIPLDARPAELLAVNSGVRADNKEPILILTVRQNLPGFKPTDLVLSYEHAERLLTELRDVFPTLQMRRRKSGPQSKVLGDILKRNRKRKENPDESGMGNND